MSVYGYIYHWAVYSHVFALKCLTYYNITIFTPSTHNMFQWVFWLHFNLKFWLCFTMYRQKHYKRTDFQKWWCWRQYPFPVGISFEDTSPDTHWLMTWLRRHVLMTLVMTKLMLYSESGYMKSSGQCFPLVPTQFDSTRLDSVSDVSH